MWFNIVFILLVVFTACTQLPNTDTFVVRQGGCHEHEDLTPFGEEEIVFNLTDSIEEEFMYEVC